MRRPQAPGVVLVVLLAVVLLGCGSQRDEAEGDPTPSPSKETPVTNVPADGLAIRISDRVAGRPGPGTGNPPVQGGPRDRGLLVDYTVTNTGSAAVVVVDRIPVQSESASGGRDKVDPLKTFVIAGSDDTIAITKRIFVPVGGPDHTVRYQGTVLAPGAKVTGRSYVPFPLRQTIPGFAGDVEAKASLPAKPAGWQLCLGVIPKVSPDDVLPGGRFALVPNSVLDRDYAQQMLCSETQQLPTGWNG